MENVGPQYTMRNLNEGLTKNQILNGLTKIAHFHAISFSYLAKNHPYPFVTISNDFPYASDFIQTFATNEQHQGMKSTIIDFEIFY